MISDRTEHDFVFKSASRINDRSLTLKQMQKVSIFREEEDFIHMSSGEQTFEICPQHCHLLLQSRGEASSIHL